VRRLIVNADDFGLTGGVNRAVVDLHRAGALTSATLMAASPRFDEAVVMALQQPALGVGCHIVLVDGSPVADPASIPSLLASPRGAGTAAQFRLTLGEFVRDLALGRIRSADIERETTAQIRRLQHAGVAVTHIDTHKHTHIFPSVLEGVLRAAAACGVHAIRNPFEPAWSLRATPGASVARRLQVRALNRFQGNFLRRVRERGFATTDGCLGVLATGTLNDTTLQSILHSMTEGTWELVCHPAYVDDELCGTRTRLKESRAVELSALRLLPEIVAHLDGSVSQIHFGKLAD
jgi:predicted glycoside hydrolase/deacetylase ChbG (UPF0249 family)